MDLKTDALTVQAMERVLQAERQAEIQLAAARAEAQALVETARQQALARVNRALERIARWQTGHAQALDLRLVAMKAQDEASTQVRAADDEPRRVAALAKVAAQITGADIGAGARPGDAAA
jgi:hypothetical protein